MACIWATTTILLAAPQSAVLGSVILVVALLLLLPLLLDVAVTLFDRVQSPLRIGLDADRRDRTALAADTGTIARDRRNRGDRRVRERHDPGAQRNLQRGLDRTAST